MNTNATFTASLVDMHRFFCLTSDRVGPIERPSSKQVPISKLPLRHPYRCRDGKIYCKMDEQNHARVELVPPDFMRICSGRRKFDPDELVEPICSHDHSED